jgi:hypothetical protein
VWVRSRHRRYRRESSSSPGNAVRTTLPPGFCRQRENLDSKLVAFSMLALCKKMLAQQTIGKLNASFCLKDCQTS